MFGILSLIAFKIGYNGTEETLKTGQTMTFFVLAMSQVIQSFNMRSDRSLFKTGVFTNKTLNKAVLVSMALVLLVLFTPLRTIFGLVTLSAAQYLICVGLFLIPTVVMEASKAAGLIKHKD